LNITVFGGSDPKPGDPRYQEALLLGKYLGQAGHTVLTGGYIGTMEAVSRGAAEAGGHVIGVTCREIENWRSVRANPWVQEEWHFDTFRERLFALIDNCQVSLALPGGVGTLVEISISWNQLIVESIPPRPLIIIGSAWQAVFNSFLTNQGSYVSEKDRHWLIFTPDIEGAVKLINDFKQ
jgi:uncharacterized protein (TIGR00725 family)